MLNFSGTAAGEPNVIPFRTILPYLRGEKGWMITIFNIGGNIGLFIPVGILIPFVIRTLTLRKTLMIALGVPLLIEMVQVIFRIGIFDIDDVILNAIGVLIGYGIVVAVRRWRK